MSEIDKILVYFKSGSLDKYDKNSIVSDSVYNVIKTLYLLVHKIGENEDNLNQKSNYKLIYFEPLIKFIFDIILKHSQKDQIIHKLIGTRFLEVLTIQINGIKYLNLIESNIKLNINEVKKNNIIQILGSKGNLPTFIFWKKMFDLDFMKDDSLIIFEKSIKNPDDRIYKWYLTEMSKNKGYILKNNTVDNILHNILGSSTPIKFVLRKIKVLSEYLNLIPYLPNMLKHTHNNEITYQLMKYYYKTPLLSENIKELSTSITDTTDAIKIYDILKTTKEKQLLILYKLVYNINNYIDDNKKVSICSGNLVSFINIKLDYNLIEEDINFIMKNINQIVFQLQLYSITDIFDNINCSCGNNCFGNLIKGMCKYNIFHKFIFNDFISKPIQVLTKFFIPYQNKYDSKFFITSIKINRVLSFLRVIAKKISKSKMINFKVKYIPIMNELMNYKPSNKPVLRNGSLNWQYQKQKFTNIPPRHLLPYEINIYDNFLIKEKADGVLVNNLPLSIFPKNEDIFLRHLKAEYIEDLELYLIFDIDLPNTNIINRYEFLRKNHSYTRDTSMKTISTMDEFISGIKEERIIFKKFLNETKENKVRWYPKVSFLVENASTEFKMDLVSNIIENKDFNFLNDEYICDGVIISPIGSREIKIKPKNLMTIDLLYDGKNWIDKDKINYNNLITVKNTVKANKIYRCYPVDNLYEPREIRYDKKHPNNSDIINQIITIYKFDWKNINYNLDNPYYHLTLNKKINLNKVYISQLEEQNNLLEKQIEKLLPENGKVWLDFGCGKGKLINYIKKYNPKKYIGIDNDINVLLKKTYLIDELDWVKYTLCNLREDWSDSKWFSFENIKADYIVLNFSMMHLFSSIKFWEQLKKVCKANTKILFNVVSENIIENNYYFHEAYMKYNKGKINYYFPWSHTHEISEDFITNNLLEETIKKYNFIVDSYSKGDLSNKSLVSKYDWFILSL